VAKDDGKTPEAHMAMKARMPGGPRKTITSLAVLARNDFQQWPTPTARDYKDGDYPSANARKDPGLGTRVQWPTPTPRGYKGSAAPEDREARGRQVNLNDLVHHEARKAGGQLNPTFVEWLQGFPKNWTEVE
jgi:DNA (cytosine-5)-methyltransferase 1